VRIVLAAICYPRVTNSIKRRLAINAADAPAMNPGTFMASFHPVSNESFGRDFGDEKEIHSTPTSSREHADTVGDRFRQRVRSSWFGGLLR
jgi:hypothetical protein